MKNAAALFGVLWLLASCGPTTSFGLTSQDNDPLRVANAYARANPGAMGPVNATGKPLAFLVARGKPKQLIAFDLEGKRELWRVDADVSSKVVVGGAFVAQREGESSIVARSVDSGKVQWKHELEGKLIGVAADSERVYLTEQQSEGGRRTWRLVALSGEDGTELWDAGAPGALGAATVWGGLVFSPFLKQWLTVIDASTGEQLARIRGIDEEISFVRATAPALYFGSKSGVFRFDERAASGKRAQSTYGSAILPEDFVRVHYHWDAFDPVQSGYSAYDRNRILWQGREEAEKVGFVDDRIVVHSYRFFFAFDTKTGGLHWAYSHPRVDAVASSHLGDRIVFASLMGELRALDVSNGSVAYSEKVDAQILGATFDALGWKPTKKGAGQGSSTAAALAAIATDRDARFAEIKKFAVTALAKLDGAEVSGDLLALVQAEGTPAFLYETAAKSLIERKDPRALPSLSKALAVRHDFVAGTKPRGTGVIAKAIANMPKDKLGKKLRARASKNLLAHLWSPYTSDADLEGVVRAFAVVADKGALDQLRSFLLLYRADPSFGKSLGAVGAAIDVLLARGRKEDRETVSFVAQDTRSLPTVRKYAAESLEHRPAPKAKEK